MNRIGCTRGFGIVVLFLCATVVYGRAEYEVHGPVETAAFERELARHKVDYAFGIWPNEEILANSVPITSVSEKFVAKIEQWLIKNLNSGLRPEVFDPNKWRGVRKLVRGSNYIVGEYDAVEQKTKLRFILDTLRIYITVESEQLSKIDPAEMTDETIMDIVSGIINVPDGDKNDIFIERSFEEIAGVPVCYGKVWTGSSHKKENREDLNFITKPWSAMPFWVAKGKLFLQATFYDFTYKPNPASIPRLDF